MKARNREVNIFNMSVLDLLTGAMGAFCFLTLALFPSYFRAQAAGLAPKRPAAAGRGKSLEQELEAEKKAGKQMPPFALIELNGTNDKNEYCATLRITSASVPPGGPGMGFRVGNADSNGGILDYQLFALRTGQYRVVVDAAPTTPNCTVSLSVENARIRTISHKISSPGPVQFDLQITGDDFSSSLFD